MIGDRAAVHLVGCVPLYVRPQALAEAQWTRGSSFPEHGPIHCDALFLLTSIFNPHRQLGRTST